VRVPPSLEPLVDMGIIQEVVRPLMSGKEAQLYVVIAGGIEQVAKVYKDTGQRSFKQRADYTDGRKVRNSRDRRAMNKRTRHGRAEEEAAWRSAEVDVIYRLRDAGVRVPTPFNFMEGVLVMELVKDADGEPAPRLGDLSFGADDARAIYDRVIQEVVRMLCAGVVHGDLSDFNILMGADGPVIIDFPQAVDPASNGSARRLLLRDVDNLHRFVRRFGAHRAPPYAQEMWALFERNELTPNTKLKGQFRDRRPKANTKDVLGLIGDAARDARRKGGGSARGRGGRRRGEAAAPQVEVLVRSEGRTRTIVQAASKPAAPKQEDAPPKKRRRRRRRRSQGRASTPSGTATS
ncbi:MAG: PA4780 family RIO1-like protein kinase, partial [Myxococcota bacterium]